MMEEYYGPFFKNKENVKLCKLSSHETYELYHKTMGERERESNARQVATYIIFIKATYIEVQSEKKHMFF